MCVCVRQERLEWNGIKPRRGPSIQIVCAHIKMTFFLFLSCVCVWGDGKVERERFRNTTPFPEQQQADASVGFSNDIGCFEMAQGLFQVEEGGEIGKKNLFLMRGRESISSWLLYTSFCLLYVRMHRLCSLQRLIYLKPPPPKFSFIDSFCRCVRLFISLLFSWHTISNDFVSSNWGMCLFSLCFVCLFWQMLSSGCLRALYIWNKMASRCGTFQMDGWGVCWIRLWWISNYQYKK
jgi:cbb3-type cytochrome oxidase subunit 3